MLVVMPANCSAGGGCGGEDGEKTCKQKLVVVQTAMYSSFVA
jgi:hypothetical protein